MRDSTTAIEGFERISAPSPTDDRNQVFVHASFVVQILEFRHDLRMSNEKSSFLRAGCRTSASFALRPAPRPDEDKALAARSIT
jgi:hypothetical protein